MKRFVVGDTVIQRHQRGAFPRLVVALTDFIDIIVVLDGGDQRFRRIFASGHDMTDQRITIRSWVKPAPAL